MTATMKTNIILALCGLAMLSTVSIREAAPTVDVASSGTPAEIATAQTNLTTAQNALTAHETWLATLKLQDPRDEPEITRMEGIVKGAKKNVKQKKKELATALCAGPS